MNDRIVSSGGAAARLLLVSGCCAAIAGFWAVAPSITSTAAPGVAGRTAAECADAVELEPPLTIASRTWWLGQRGGGRTDQRDPTNMESFEAAVVSAVAEQLGFDRASIVFDFRDPRLGPDLDIAAPGEKDFDLAISNVAITDERRRHVDVSVSYYDVEQVLIAASHSSAAAVTSIDDMRGLQLGAYRRTLSVANGAALAYVDERIAPMSPVVVLGAPWSDPGDDRDLLTSGELDAVVVDQPTAAYLFDPTFRGPWAGFEDLDVVAVLPRARPTAEQLGMVLPLGSPLTACVDIAITALRDSGTLDELERDWLRAGGAIPRIPGAGPYRYLGAR